MSKRQPLPRAAGAVAAKGCAHMALRSMQLVPDLTEIESERLNTHFKRKHGPGAYYGQKG